MKGQDQMRKNVKIIGNYILSMAFFALVLAAFAAGAMAFSKKAQENGADTLRAGIQRASVQCYAIEGRYPPSVEYLEENYGIQVDRERYSVLYSGFASNVMPDITVVELVQEQ